MTTNVIQSNKVVLSKADPNTINDVFRKMDLGNMMELKEYDTGVITATAAVTIPGGALQVLSARVVSSGTAASVGTYMVGDSAVTPLLPPGGASAAVGIASAQGITAPGAGLTTSGKITTITFPNTVTRVVIRYLSAPAITMTDEFAP